MNEKERAEELIADLRAATVARASEPDHWEAVPTAWEKDRVVLAYEGVLVAARIESREPGVEFVIGSERFSLDPDAADELAAAIYEAANIARGDA